jgi:hypothetical protein
MQDRRGLKADEAIGDKEYVGRRIAARPALVGAIDQLRQKKPYDLRDFEETRPPYELSLDWLGKTGLDSKVRRDLLPQAQRMFAEQKPAKTFGGWAFLQAYRLSKARKDHPCAVVASPEMPNEPDHPYHNPYHVVVRPSEKFGSPYLAALHLHAQFVQHGQEYLVPRLSLYKRVVARLKGIYRAIVQFYRPSN